MLFSIITPCKRVNNLPIIYDGISKMGASHDIEWIVVYDSESIDERILEYEEKVPIRLYNLKKQEGDSMASRQRNLGIEKSCGDYLYFLDDDNLIYPRLLNKIQNYLDGESIIIVNQFDSRLFDKRIKNFSINNINFIDTAQLIVPKKYNHVKWTNDVPRCEETPYLKNLLVAANNKHVYVDRCYSHYNYLRRFWIKSDSVF